MPETTTHTPETCADLWTYDDLDHDYRQPGDENLAWENRVRCTVCGRTWVQTD
jgi:hypothetical protein